MTAQEDKLGIMVVKERNMTDLSGEWHSYYRYQSSGRGGEDFWGRHLVTARVDDQKLRIESVPESKSHVVLELTLDPEGKTASGTWREETDPNGYYGGDIFEGTITLEVASDGQRMNGTWRGASRDGTMNSDIWEFSRENGKAERREG